MIVLIAHDIRSCHNVGSLLRTAEGLGIARVYLTGYTPYPMAAGDQDERMPHLAWSINGRIAKTALGAEKLVNWQHQSDIKDLLAQLKADGFKVSALEQSPQSLKLPEYKAAAKQALVLGNELSGLEDGVLGLCDNRLEIPMFGKKESFNVVQAAAMALYHLVFKQDSK